MTAPAPKVPRLSFFDDTFLKFDRVLGLPLINQVAIISEGPLDLARLQAAYQTLSGSVLNRLVIRPATPLARSYFVPAPATAPMQIESDPIDVDEEHYWFDAHLQTHLDPQVGPPWVLAAAPRVSGGHLVSFVFSHVLGDAGTFLTMLEEIAKTPVSLPQAVPAPSARDHLGDAVGQLGAIGSGVRTAYRQHRQGQRVGRPQGAVPTPPRPEVGPTSQRLELGTALVFSIDEEQFAAVAAAAGGSLNTLLMGISVDALVKAGRVGPGQVVPVSVPVLDVNRTSEANATVGVVIPAAVDEVLAHDLSGLRAASKEKFVGLADGSSPNPLVALRPLVQSVPDVLVRAVGKRAKGALLTVSNVGVLPDYFPDLFAEQVEAVGVRSIIQGASAVQARVAQMGLTVHASCWQGRWTISMAVGDPDFFPNLSGTRQIFAQVLQEWGLTPHWW